MKLPPINRFMVEDFPGQEKWIERLLSPLNQIFLSLSTGINRGITFKDNITSMQQTLSFQNVSAAFPLKFTNTMGVTPSCLWVGNIKDVTAIPKSLSGGVFCQWSFDASQNQISISSVTGLVANQSYQLTVLVV